MGIWSRIFGGVEERSGYRLFDPWNDRVVRVDGTGYVSNETASGHAVAHRCVQCIAENLSSVPLRLYKRAGQDGRAPATAHPLYSVLHDQANEHTDAFMAREALITSLLINGNGYARLERNDRGQVIAMHPILQGVSVERLASGRLRYKVDGPDGKGTITLLDDDVLHLRYRMAPDGIVGLSPIAIARSTFSLAISQNTEAVSQSVNAFRPAGILVHPKRLSTDGMKNLREVFMENLIGAHKAGRPLVLQEGVEFKSISMSAKDSEFLDSRKLSNLDIARVYGVPPTCAGIVDQATYSNVEGESRALVQRCLAPMARRIEMAMMHQLLTREQRKTMLIEHELTGLLRGDDKARFDAYAVGRQWAISASTKSGGLRTSPPSREATRTSSL